MFLLFILAEVEVEHTGSCLGTFSPAYEDNICDCFFHLLLWFLFDWPCQLTIVFSTFFTPPTSKYCHSDVMHAFPASFGLKGEVQSCISSLSSLKIVTKTHRMPNGYRKV